MSSLQDDVSAEAGDKTDRPRNGGGRSIVLVGLMGAGKSAVGRRLAQRLDMPFVDADEEIEAAAGCTIADFFELHGEAAFRDGEKKVIARLLDGPPIVLATGGGAFMNDETRARILETALAVWLRADLATLVERTARRDHRPLLRGKDHETTLRALMDERYPVYAEAPIVIDSGAGPVTETVEKVIEAIDAIEAQEAGR